MVLAFLWIKVKEIDKNRIKYMTADNILPFQIDNVTVKGRLVRLKDTLDEILNRHNYPEIVNNYLAEMIALSAALSADAKYQGLFTLQISGDGPLRMMVVDMTTDGEVRACAKYDQNALEILVENKETSLAQLFGVGCIVFTVDLADTDDRYQAVVDLSGATLADCMHHFFRQSDQIQAGIVIVADVSKDAVTSSKYRAAALILQKMPGLGGTSEELEQEADDWFTDLSLLGTVTKKELLDIELSSKDLLYRLFSERGISVYPERPVIARCSCSRERIEVILNNFSKEDQHNMVIDEKIIVTCEFCSEVYEFESKN